MNTYSAKELAEILQKEGAKEMTVRKIRYYRQIGLLPELITINNKNYFTDEHLEHLRAARTMKKTGETLEGIKSTLSLADENLVKNIGTKMSYYSTEKLISTDTYQFNDDISFLFSNKIREDLKKDIINTVTDIIKNKK